MFDGPACYLAPLLLLTRCNVQYDDVVNFLATVTARGHVSCLVPQCLGSQKPQVILRSAHGGQG